jgi:multidrug efflux system outer membrane protein
MMRQISLAALAASTMLAGCSLAPDYTRGPVPVAATWPDETLGTGTTASADRVGWRDFFADPRLQQLIEIALKNNRDLRVAVLNVEASEAQFREQRADLFPKISLTGNGEVESLSKSTVIPAGNGNYQGTGGGGIYHYYTAGIGFTSYELDLFGQQRSLTDQAFEQYLSTAETRRSTELTLVATVAIDYLTWLQDQELLRLTQETLNNQIESYNLTKAMFDRETTTGLSLAQAESLVDGDRASLAQYQRQLQQAENALTLVLGQPIPTDLPPGKPLDAQGLLADLPAGLPSDLLNRRPDILSAEHTLIAANANIGAARAAFFPSITLTASDGLASNKLSTLFTKAATTWSFAPQINIPIFTAGQNEAALDYAKTEKNVDVAQYEKTIQTAFREVSDALVARRTYRDQLDAQQKLVKADQEAYRLAELRFRAGVDNYLTSLDAQRSLFAAQQDLVQLKEAELANLVTLYKALGGGWNEHNVDTASSAETP